MIALSLSILALAVAIIAHVVWTVLRFRGQDRRIREIAASDWTDEETDRITRSVKAAT